MANVEEVAGAGDHWESCPCLKKRREGRGDTIFGSRVGSEWRLLGGGQDLAGTEGKRESGGGARKYSPTIVMTPNRT